MALVLQQAHCHDARSASPRLAVQHASNRGCSTSELLDGIDIAFAAARRQAALQAARLQAPGIQLALGQPHRICGRPANGVLRLCSLQRASLALYSQAMQQVACRQGQVWHMHRPSCTLSL